MSQYPSPYSQPPYFQPPIDFSQYHAATPADLLAPARRAAILQGVLGALVMFCGVLIGAVVWAVEIPVDEIVSKSGMAVPELPNGMSLEQMIRITYTSIGGCSALIGVVLLVLCFYVRKGSVAPIITSILVEGLVMLVLVLNVGGGLVQMPRNPAIGFMSLLVAGVPLLTFGLNVMWLISAARNAPRLRMAQQQQQAQYFQYQQQYQSHGSPWPQAPSPNAPAASWSAPMNAPAPGPSQLPPAPASPQQPQNPDPGNPDEQRPA